MFSRILALCCPLSLCPTAGWADACDQLPVPSVTVKRLDKPFVASSQWGYQNLTGMAASTARQGFQVLGLTVGEVFVQFESKLPAYIDRIGRWECASPQLTLTYGFDPMTVYVAKEFPAGTCAYKEIYQHELRHVKAYQDHFAGIEKEITETLTRRFATEAPWRGPVGKAEGRIQQEMEARWVPYVKRVLGQVEAAQALIDTPEEYARVADSCNGDIKKLLH